MSEYTVVLMRVPSACKLSDEVIKQLEGQPIYDGPGSKRQLGTILRAWSEEADGQQEIRAKVDTALNLASGDISIRGASG